MLCDQMGLEKRMMLAFGDGTRRRGRPRRKWMDEIHEVTGMKLAELRDVMAERKHWRRMVKTVARTRRGQHKVTRVSLAIAMQWYVIVQPVGTRQSLSLFSVLEGQSSSQLTLQLYQSYYSIFGASNRKQILCKITLFLILH